MKSILKKFDNPDETRTFEKGRFDIVRVGGLTIGRAIYEPGWRWSVDVGAETGSTLCEVEHVGLVLEGEATVAYADGTIERLTPGTIFHIPQEGHDSWVVGDAQYVSLHFMGADHYAS